MTVLPEEVFIEPHIHFRIIQIQVLCHHNTKKTPVDVNQNRIQSVIDVSVERSGDAGKKDQLSSNPRNSSLFLFLSIVKGNTILQMMNYNTHNDSNFPVNYKPQHGQGIITHYLWK